MVLMKMAHTLHKNMDNKKKSDVPENKFTIGNKNLYVLFAQENLHLALHDRCMKSTPLLMLSL